MRPAINDLAQYPDEKLFAIVADGIGYITENAQELDRLARRLHEQDEIHGSNIMRRLAEEEAAKVLVLVDLIRCPTTQSAYRSQTIKHFYDHVAKGIYAKSVMWRPAVFQDLCDYVDIEKAGFHLDGPHDVDWLMRNAITSDREWAMYVDYVQDVTVEDGEHLWHYPHYDDSGGFEYRSPGTLKVSDALKGYGAASADGLEFIASLWRKFEPEPSTDRGDHISVVFETLEKLEANGLATETSSDAGRTILEGWAFPMWSLALRGTSSRSSENQLIRELRQLREKIINRWSDTEKRRDPQLEISRQTIERLSDAFGRWQVDIDAIRKEYFGDQNTGIRIEPAHLMNQYDELQSYGRLECLLTQLTESERIDLVALAWFARQRPYNWPQNHRNAKEMISRLDLKYQTGLGKDWLRGLEIFESDTELPSTLAAK